MTPAERVALQLLADGSSMSQVAALLELGDCELDDLLTALFKRMRVQNATRSCRRCTQTWGD
jgi:DNA-binding CsgD family transcriptional regulator